MLSRIQPRNYNLSNYRYSVTSLRGRVLLFASTKFTQHHSSYKLLRSNYNLQRSNLGVLQIENGFILRFYSSSTSMSTKWKRAQVKSLDTPAIIDKYSPFKTLDKVLSLVSISKRKATAMSILAYISQTDQRSKTSSSTEMYIVESSKESLLLNH